MLRELPAHCPFCGSRTTPPDLDGEASSWMIVCPDCGCTGPNAPTRDDAVTLWNKRVIVLPQAETFGETQ